MSAGDLLWGRFKSQVTARSMVEHGDTVVVAVSGGPDSTALLHLLWRLAQEPGWRFRVWVAHLDHGFRGAESAADAEAVRELAARLRLPASIARIDAAGEIRRRRLSKQAGARDLRYAFLRRVAALAGARRIALGHTADDQAETVLLNLLRGTGPTGLAGIPPVRDEFIRPLLSWWREEIITYLEENGLQARTDRTNLEPVYARNRVRLKLLPELQSTYNPRIKEELIRLAAMAASENELLEALAAEARRGVWLVARVDGSECRDGQDVGAPEVGDVSPAAVVRIDAARLAVLPVALQRRVLRQAAEATLGPGGAVSFEALERLRSLAVGMAAYVARHAGKELELGAGLRARAATNGPLIELTRVSAESQAQSPSRVADALTPLPVPGKATLWPGGPRVLARELTWDPSFDPRKAAADPRTAAIDLDKVRFPLWVRLRCPGDRFRPLGAGGAQKLKEFFIDHRVPAGLRDKTPLVVSGPGGEDIIWVAGYRIDERYRVDNTTTRVVELRLENNAQNRLHPV